MKLMKQLMAFTLTASLTAGLTAGVMASETEADSAAASDTVKLGLMIAKNGQSLSSDEWEVLADIFEDVINNKHEDLSLPFAADEGLPNLGGAKVEFVTGEQNDTQTAVPVAEHHHRSRDGRGREEFRAAPVRRNFHEPPERRI